MSTDDNDVNDDLIWEVRPNPNEGLNDDFTAATAGWSAGLNNMLFQTCLRCGATVTTSTDSSRALDLHRQWHEAVSDD